MAQAFLLSATPPTDTNEENLQALVDLRERAARDRFGVHSLTDDPEAADLILFVEAYGAGFYFEKVRAHPLTRKYREKCFLFCCNPYVIPMLPGIYTAIEKRWASRRTVSGFYLGLTRNEFTTFTPPADDLPYLYSFVGSTKNAGVRGQLATLVHPRALVQDTSADFKRVLHRQMDARERAEYYRRYADATKSSKFVLCPRGISVSSIRVFETMSMGRVPVILSDDWVPPPGPSWDKFAIRVRESDWADVPRILEEREHEAVAMGKLAHAQWDEWFSDEVAFHRVVEWCLAIKQQRRLPESLARWSAYLHFLRPLHLRRIAGAKLRAWRGVRGQDVIKRPFLLRVLPEQLRERVYFRRYRPHQHAWRELFTRAPLSACPAMIMHDLVPGDEISGAIAFNGFYERELTKTLAQQAARGGLLVDVGANMGYFALVWAGINPTNRVVALEASPRNVEILKSNVSRNRCEDRVTIVAKAAGDHNGTVTFDTGPAEQTGWGGIAAGDPENRIVVPMVRLDEELPDTEIDVLKIDTEGADALVLFGCEQLLKARRIKAIYFEQNADKIERIGLRPDEAQRFLKSMNYDCRSLNASETDWFASPA